MAARPLAIDFLISEVAAVVGEGDVTARVVSGLAYAQAYCWLGQVWVGRGHEPCRPALIWYPESTGEVARLVKIAARYRIPVIPYGGGSGTQGGVVPLYGGLVLDLKKMNRIVRLDEKSLTVRAQ